MKYSKKLQLVLFVLILSGFGFMAKPARGDEGPPPPDCAGGVTGKATPITCGFLDLNVSIDLAQYKDRFVILDNASPMFGGNHYVDLGSKTALDFSWKTSHSYLAVDKSYFDENGGIRGIFATTTPQENDYQEGYITSPKDQAGFKSHSYNFVGLSSPNPYEPIDYLDCGRTALRCTKTINYVPKSISGNNIIMTEASVSYFPTYIGK